MSVAEPTVQSVPAELHAASTPEDNGRASVNRLASACVAEVGRAMSAR